MRCAPFFEFEEEVRRACGASAPWRAPAQVNYLASEYLTKGSWKAKTLLIEEEHVDRHYLEEYSAYYSTLLHAPRSRTVRIHFFDESFAEPALDEWIAEAISNGDAERLLARLSPHYLGFTTIRPIPDAPIGRTVLRPYADEPSRCYRPAEINNSVHVLGVTLRVEGLPFQQQEQAVGACATTALWCALASATRATGERAPTPFSVTSAATRHYTEVRPFPATDGLNAAQIIAAIRESGFSPYVLKPGSKPSSFLLSLKTYVASGIPAILLLDEEGSGNHAVTVCGFREDDNRAAQIAVQMPGGVTLRSSGLSRLYVHDDREGPYLRMVPSVVDTEVRLHRFPYSKPSPDACGANIWYAFFPLYPKLRLTARELAGIAADVDPLLKHALGVRYAECRIEMFFRMNGAYLAELYTLGLDPDRLRPFLKESRFSRYVGVIRYFVGEDLVADVVCDTTDISRTEPRSGEVIGVAAYATNLRAGFEDFCTRRNLSRAVVL